MWVLFCDRMFLLASTKSNLNKSVVLLFNYCQDKWFKNDYLKKKIWAGIKQNSIEGNMYHVCFKKR